MAETAEMAATTAAKNKTQQKLHRYKAVEFLLFVVSLLNHKTRNISISAMIERNLGSLFSILRSSICLPRQFSPKAYHEQQR